MADVFGKWAEVFGKWAEDFGKWAEDFGKWTEVFGKWTEVFGKRQAFFDVLVGEYASTGGPVAHEGNVPNGAALDRFGGHRLIREFYRSGLAWIATQKAFILQRSEVCVHGGRR